MSKLTKVYLLEREGQFWEITVDKVPESDAEYTTTIRAGKKGNKGRKYPSKKHASLRKAQQFALQQVNSKHIQGYEPTGATSVPKSALRRSGTSLRRSASKVKPKARPEIREWRKPPKKQSTVQRLTKQRTMQNAGIPDATPLTGKPSQGADSSTSQHSNVRHNPDGRPTSSCKLSRQSTLLLASNSSAKGSVSMSRDKSVSRVSLARTKSVGKWRKPHKKQSTIRRMAKSSSTLQKSASLRKTLFLKD